MSDCGEARFSRTVKSCGFGKCTADIKTAVPDEVKEHMSALAVINGQSLSEYTRDLFIQHCFGHVSIIQAKLGNGTPRNGRE